jgi:GT2 family glycosyltransferase
LSGIQDGALAGWIAAAEPVELEALADGEEPFATVRAEPGEDGRAHFAIPIPEAYVDGRMRFFDVRLSGEDRALDGGPVAFDGGLFASLGLGAPAAPAVPYDSPPVVEGEVSFEAPGRVEGWAWAPAEPDRRLKIEILAGQRLIATVAADRPDPRAGGDGRHGFLVDLARLLRYGPHEVVIRAAGTVQPLRGGRFQTGVFAADGEVDCPGYLDLPNDRAALERLPFEHQAHAAERVDAGRLVPRLINRLRRERMSFSATGGPEVLLLALPGADDGAAGVWALQSWPTAPTLAAGSGPAAIKSAAAKAAFVTFAGMGDILHPSTAGILARADDCDVVAWPRFCADAAEAGAAGWLLRRPPTDLVTVAHGSVSDTTLAVRGSLLAEAPAGVLEALAQGRMHPLWLWLASRPLNWRNHAEALTSRIGDWSPPSRAELERDAALCAQLIDAKVFAFARAADDLPMPQVLVPHERARKTSVVIPYRGRPAMTLRCLHALAGQRLTGELELVLVDNQSDPADAEQILDGARRMLGPARVVALSYDAPFNHSAQNNLGARAATGEVLVICNNDIALKDPALLEQLGAWALRPGYATVGCRLEDPERERGSYGHEFRPPSENPFRPPLQESSDPAYGRFVHAVPGNTLALAAIRRELYLELGGLDEARLPIGYNDVDFMLRCTRRGLSHLYLGHVVAEHRRGSSRTGDDEDLQALMINQAYPEAAQGHLAQLSRQRIDPEEGQAAATGLDAEEAALARSLEVRLEQHAAEEQKRADLAESLERARERIVSLEGELGR